MPETFAFRAEIEQRSLSLQIYNNYGRKKQRTEF